MTYGGGVFETGVIEKDGVGVILPPQSYVRLIRSQWRAPE